MESQSSFKAIYIFKKNILAALFELQSAFIFLGCIGKQQLIRVWIKLWPVICICFGRWQRSWFNHPCSPHRVYVFCIIICVLILISFSSVTSSVRTTRYVVISGFSVLHQFQFQFYPVIDEKSMNETTLQRDSYCSYVVSSAKSAFLLLCNFKRNNLHVWETSVVRGSPLVEHHR